MASKTKSKTKPKTKAKPKKKSQKKNTAKSDKKRIIAIVILTVAALGIAAAVFAFHSGRKQPPAAITFDKEVAWGIDVSHHNGKIDWKKVSAAADFAFIRVGYRGYTKGEINKDTQADDNLKQANKNDIPVGVYFYSQAINEAEAEEEAAFLLDNIKHYDISLPVVLDFEYAFVNGQHGGRLYDAQLTKEQRTSLINAFCDKVRRAGYIPGVYASSYIFRTELNMKDLADDIYIWVADYNKVMTYAGRYDIRQYSESGACDGVSENVDTNYFYTQNRNQE